jgi:hypothetical protein
VSGRRRQKTLAVTGVLLFGAACFWAGRFSGWPTANHAGPAEQVAGGSSSVEVPASAPVAVPSTVIQTNVASGNSSGWDEQQWQQLRSQPGTVARNAALAALLEKLAALDPKRAMAMAQAEGNLKLKDSLVQAALHGWARTSPTNAANWALALSDPSARETALTSVFAGALVTNPDAAVRVCNLACQQDPGGAAGYGSRLVDALCNAGNFDVAAQFAATGDGAVQQSLWAAEAYSKWAELQPEQAGAAAMAINDPNARNQALHGVVGGWAATDPAGLANFLSQLPAGGDRGAMLGQALQNWVGQDPLAAADWINDHSSEFGSDLDKGMASVATLNTITPDVAVAWAQGISNDELRSEALTDILRNWVQTDLSAARSFFETTADLQPADRQQVAEIIAGINGQNGQTASQ